MCFWVERTTETRFILNLVSYSNQYTTGGKSSSWSTYHSPESKVPATLARKVSVWMALTPVHRQALKTWVKRVGHRHERSYVIKSLSFYDIVSMVNFSFNLCRTTSNASAVHLRSIGKLLTSVRWEWLPIHGQNDMSLGINFLGNWLGDHKHFPHKQLWLAIHIYDYSSSAIFLGVAGPKSLGTH